MLGVGPGLPLQFGEHVVGAARILLTFHDRVRGPGKSNDCAQSPESLLLRIDLRFGHFGDPLFHLLLDLVFEVNLQQRSGVGQLRRPKRGRSPHVCGGCRGRLVIRGREQFLLGGCEINFECLKPCDSYICDIVRRPNLGWGVESTS